MQKNASKLLLLIMGVALLLVVGFTAIAQDEASVKGGTLTIGTGIVPGQNYIPPSMGSISQLQQIDSMFLRLVYGREWTDGLNPPETGPVELGIAETMVEIEPNRVWEFMLREDVFWHDGMPVTADDVIFGIWMALNADLPSLTSAPKPNGILGATR